MARVFPGAVSGGCRRHWPGYSSSVVSLLSLCSSRREGASTLRCVCSERKRRFAMSGPPFTHYKRGVCLCVRHRHSQIAARAAARGGRVRCHGLLYIQCGCMMQFGAKRCVQRARPGCTRHDGRAKPAWATCTGPARAPHSVRRSRIPTNHIY
jgi:hypothetical protein